MKLDRAAAIRQVLFSKGHMSISEIAKAVDASEPTIRRDLNALEQQGAIARTRGGAKISDSAAVEVEFEARESISLDAKRAIGERAYDQLAANSSVFLDAGTTVLQLARLIRLKPMHLRVFTNCLPVAQILMPVEGLSVTLLGGILRPQNASMVGPLAEHTLNELWFDQVFLGVGAIADDLTVFSSDEQEARINRLMLERTQQSIILTDSSKFGNRLTYKVAPLDAGMIVVSDDDISPDFQDKLKDRQIKCLFAQAAR